jgi:hypothetical protein
MRVADLETRILARLLNGSHKVARQAFVSQVLFERRIQCDGQPFSLANW